MGVTTLHDRELAWQMPSEGRSTPGSSFNSWDLDQVINCTDLNLNLLWFVSLWEISVRANLNSTKVEFLLKSQNFYLQINLLAPCQEAEINLMTNTAQRGHKSAAPVLDVSWAGCETDPGFAPLSPVLSYPHWMLKHCTVKNCGQSLQQWTTKSLYPLNRVLYNWLLCYDCLRWI